MDKKQLIFQLYSEVCTFQSQLFQCRTQQKDEDLNYWLEKLLVTWGKMAEKMKQLVIE